ncbi:MAG: sulfide/dihydroorotate dehydrogenase-like FAD/NAD-binding protein [Thermotaleaceae bacterium]
MNEKIRCIDAGSEYCPCYLAETGNCIVCSHLQNKEMCECDWCGTCIFNEFYWNSYTKKKSRESVYCKILQKKFINSQLAILSLQISKGLARQLIHPGSYAMFRNPDKPHYFDIPISILDVTESTGRIDIAVQSIGAKSKTLLDASEHLLIKGPYWNGIIGLEYFKKLSKKNVLLVVRGIAQAPAVSVIKNLYKNKNNITLVLDPGNVDSSFIKDYIHHFNVEIISLDLKSKNNILSIENLIKDRSFDLIFSGGSDLLHGELLQIIRNLEKEIDIAATNNHEICCGEGICGACSTFNKDGNLLKMCKNQVQLKEIL